MQGNIDALHGILSRLGFKVLACPDHVEREDMNVTLYGNKTGMMVTVEEPDKNNIIKTLKKDSPVTGSTTSEEAAGLLQEGLIHRDAR